MEEEEEEEHTSRGSGGAVVVVVGSGGREHCLAWKLSHSSCVRQIYVLPGNGGTQLSALCSLLSLSLSLSLLL